MPIINRTSKTVAFVGRPDNVESLTMLYAWLIQQVQMVAREERRVYVEKTGEHMDPLRWQVNFGVGAVERLSTRLEEEKAKQTEEMARNDMGDVVGLAIRRDSENSDYLEKKYGYRVDGRETERERKWREKREAEQRQREEWKARDPKGYFARYPNEDPANAERVAAEKKLEDEKWWKEYRQKERRNAKRRENYTRSWREPRYDPEAERKEEQAERARRTGRTAADKINLKPFLTGDVAASTDKQMNTGAKKIGGKS